MSVSEKPLHIDIPVKLAEVKVAKAHVIAVFHTNAGHVTLNDSAYNAERNVATGNPYKKLVADLMKRGAQIELCGATAKVHKW